MTSDVNHVVTNPTIRHAIPAIKMMALAIICRNTVASDKVIQKLEEKKSIKIN
jgi:hypothetical protein